GANGYLHLARGGNFLGIGNFAYALMPGAASAGSCLLPDGSCIEMSAADCSDAAGTFGGLGTFCATPCPLTTGPVHVPMLSRTAISGLVLVLAVVGLASALVKRPQERRYRIHGTAPPQGRSGSG